MARKKNSVSAADKIKQKQEELEEKKRQQAAKEAEKAAQKAAQKAASAASKVPSTTGKTGTGTTAKPSTSSSSTFTQAKKSTQKKAQVPVPELGAGTSVSETNATSAPQNTPAAQKKASGFISRSEVAKTQTPKTTQKQTTNRGSIGTGSMVAREATGRRNFLDVLEQDSERTTSGSPNVLNARREEQLRYQYPANMKWLEEYTRERNAVDPFVNQNQNQPGAGLRSAYVDQRRREELAAAKRENDQAIIDEYESIPNYDFLSTYRNPLARRQAERKQELEPEYRKLKNAQMIEQLHDLGFSDDDIHAALDQTAYNNLEMADRLWNTAQENGINISDIASAFDEYNRELTARRAAENPGWESAGSIITNPIESLSGVAGNVANYLSGRPISPKYSYTDTVRETVGNNIDSKLGRAAYDLSMSGADMLTSLALAGLTGGGSAVAGGLQGLEKADRVIRDSVGRGLSRDQVMAEGVLSGVSTALTEKLPLDTLSNLAKGAYAPLKALLWQGIAEGGQEVAEGALDTAIDMLVAGKDSSVALRYNELLRNGYNTGEAIYLIAQELDRQGASDFLGGAILGGGMGLVGNLLFHNNPIPSLEDTTNVPPTSPETTLNPATMARQNENAVADAVRQRAEIVQNIEALNNQIQEQTAPVQTQTAQPTTEQTLDALEQTTSPLTDEQMLEELYDRQDREAEEREYEAHNYDNLFEEPLSDPRYAGLKEQDNSRQKSIGNGMKYGADQRSVIAACSKLGPEADAYRKTAFAEIAQYLQDGNEDHLENALMLAEEIDSWFPAGVETRTRMSGKRGMGRKQITYQKILGTQDIAGKMSKIISEARNTRYQNTVGANLPENVSTAIENIKNFRMSADTNKSASLRADSFLTNVSYILSDLYEGLAPSSEQYSDMTETASNILQAALDEENTARTYGTVESIPEDKTVGYVRSNLAAILDYVWKAASDFDARVQSGEVTPKERRTYAKQAGTPLSQEELTGHYLSEEEENALAEEYAEREAEEDAYAELDADGHTPEQRKVIEEYAKATDPEVKQWIDRKRNDLPTKPYRVVGSVPDAVAEIVKNDLGIDISGNTVGFDINGLRHITKQHMNPGNGKQYITDEDLAKIGYIIEHPDEIVTRRLDGSIDYSYIYGLSDNRPAPKIILRKKIDGHYYVIEAVSDAKNHRNVIVSAFIAPVGSDYQHYEELFKGAYHVTNAADSSAPSSNVQDAHENSSSNANISLEDESVNTDQQTNSGSGRTLAAEVEREENPHIEMEIPEYGPEPGEATPGEEWEDRDRSAQYESPDRMKSTQAARNTLWSLPTVQQNVEMQKYMLEQEANGTFSADVVHNIDSVLKATEAIDKAVERDGNVDGLLNDILGNGTSIDSLGAVQQDELMMCLDMKLAEAARTGDFTGVEEILRKTNTREHNIGQALQALAKYTNTSSAAISKANKLIDGNTDAYFRRPGNQGKKNTNAKLARALATMGNKYADVKAEVKPPTHAELLQQVRNTLEPEFASVDELISDSTIEQITALLEGNIPMWQLRDELEHYFKNGEFYTIYEGEEEMHKKSRELATALDKVVKGDPEKAAPEPKTLQQIRDEINTLLEDSEYASIYDEFSDEDIEFLANRIFRGAGQDELVDRLNRKLATGHLGMSNEDLAEVVRLYDEVNSGQLTSEEEYDAMQAANKILASYLGKGTILERLNQWRYLCMLSAPSTHLKNIASNATWGMVTGIKDAVAAAGEEALQRAGVDFQRTKAIINPAKEADRAILQGAYEAFNRDSYADYARGGSRYNDRSEIKQAQQIGSKPVNAAANLNSDLLSKEDIFFGRMKYAQALAGYVKANGRTADVFNSTDPADMAFLKQAEEYALSEANKTTFHEENELAAKITQASRSASEGGTAGLNVAIEALMPFKRTTANIGKQFLVEYNPVVQFPKAIIQTMQKNGDVAGTIDSYAKGLTGTGLVALGLWLAKSGLMVARKDDDDKSDVLNEAQNYAITWTSEDGTSHSYTIDGLAPTAMLMCVGAELAEKGFTLEALAGMGESFLGNTLLSGFESVFNAIGRAYAARQYDPDKHIGTAVAADMVNSYASQYIPTLMGKVARTVDPIRRNTYYTGKTGDTDTLLGYAQKAAAKIPFLSKTLQPYVDAYGNEERQPGKNAVSRFLYNMFSIGYYSERERDAIQDKISELDQYSQSLDDVAREEMEKTLNSLFGSASKSYDGEKLTPEQYAQYQKVLGNNTVNLYNGMLSSERFQSLNPEGQAQLMHDLGLFANALSKKELFDYQPGGSSKYVKLFKAYEESGIDGVVDAYCDSVEKSQEKKANSESAAEPEGSNSQTIPEYNPMAATGVNYAETPEQIPEPQQQPAPKQEPIPEPEVPKYDSSKVFSSYGYVAPGGAAELKNAGYSDKERGQILFNDQKEPGKAVQRAKDKNGYAGVAAYYDLYDAADQAGDGNGKAKKQEIIDYLQSENESVDEINAWMDIFGWNHISDSGTRSLPMLEEEEFAQAQLGQPATNGMPIPELYRTPVGRQKRVTEGGTGVSLRGATGLGMPVSTGGPDTTYFYSKRDEMARPTAEIADELLSRAVSDSLGNEQLYDIIRDPADMRVYIQELGYDDSRFSDDDIKKMQQAVYQYLRYANSNVAI